MQIEPLSKHLSKLKNDELYWSVLAALEAGNKIVNMKPDSSKQKSDSPARHHAILTKADEESQKMILKNISRNFPDAYYITEEKVMDKRLKIMVLNASNYYQNLDKLVFGIDPLDGTSQYQNGLYEFCVSIGSMKKMSHNSGVIYAPKILNGFIVFGAKEKNVYFAEGNRNVQKGKIAEDKNYKDSFLSIGVDILAYPEYNTFINTVAQKSRTIGIAGSCELGLALLAAGKRDAMIQPAQRVWDWFAGYPLVEWTGGKVLFYRIESGKIKPVEKLSKNDYNPESLHLGFIAGNPRRVDALMDELIKLYGK